MENPFSRAEMSKSSSRYSQRLILSEQLFPEAGEVHALAIAHGRGRSPAPSFQSKHMQQADCGRITFTTSISITFDDSSTTKYLSINHDSSVNIIHPIEPQLPAQPPPPCRASTSATTTATSRSTLRASLFPKPHPPERPSSDAYMMAVWSLPQIRERRVGPS